MIYPVTIKTPEGATKKVITSESLKARSDALFDAGGGLFKSHVMREGICGREDCQRPFWTKQRGKIYCSTRTPSCSLVSQRETALQTKARNKAKLKKKKEENGTN